MQHIALIYMDHIPGLVRAENYAQTFASQLPVWNDLLHEFDFRISVFQRATFTEQITHNDIDIYFIADGSENSPHNLQRTEKLHSGIAAVDPSVVHIRGLGLPLHFRWLRARLGEKPLLIGEHRGEGIWHHRKLWLQQFGLRSADAFFFQQKQDAHPWLKHAAILPCQPVFTPGEHTTFDAPGLATAYRNMMRWRRERVA